MAEILNVFLLAMTPIGELRAALPAGILFYDLSWETAFLVSVVGNLVPVVFLLLLLGPVSKWLSDNFLICKRLFDWIFERTRRKTNNRMKKYGDVALISFVAIPLPFTGAWTGAIAAFLFGVKFKKAFLLIGLGVLISALIVLTLIQTKVLWLI